MDAEAELSAERGERLNAIICDLWFVRSGLAPPNIPAQTLAAFLTDFPKEEMQPISACYISRVRDAFAEIIKELKDQALITILDQGDPSASSVLIRHVHDEAAMRLRSYGGTSVTHEPEIFPHQIGGSRFSRSRTTKIQNNVVDVCFAGKSISWLTELQPLLRKDGPTIASALVLAVQGIVTGVEQQCDARQKRARIIHCLVGDGVNTNENASKRLYKHFSDQGAASNFSYFLLVWKCASHQSNLVVNIAICGRFGGRPAEEDLVCCACSIFFKYLLADYVDEFAEGLRRHVVSRLELVPTCLERPAVRTLASTNAVMLYGHDIFPQRLLDVLNVDVAAWQHGCTTGTDRTVVAGKLYQIIYQLVLKVEEKPVVTRFWLFTGCVFALMLLKYLAIPADAFRLLTTSPRPENARRLTAFLVWYQAPDTDAHLRKVALCLRLTLYATRITAKKSKTADGKPILVRLGDGDVQRNTGALFAQIVPLLFTDGVLDVSSTLLSMLTTMGHLVIRFQAYRLLSITSLEAHH